MVEEEIKKTILELLQPLQEKQNRVEHVLRICLFACISLCILICILFSAIFWTIVVTFALFGILAFSGDIIIGLSKRQVLRAYCEKFPPNSAERSAADQLLSSFQEPKLAADALRKKLGVKSAEEARREVEAAEKAAAEAESRRRRFKHAQKAFIYTDTFKCGSCDSNVAWEQGVKDFICSQCKVKLSLPSDMACPSCGSLTIGIVSKPRTTGKLAGLIMYGPAGLLAGEVLDSIKDGLERTVRQKVRNPVFFCESCNVFWGIKLPVWERSMTKAEWKRQDRERRIDYRSQ